MNNQQINIEEMKLIMNLVQYGNTGTLAWFDGYDYYNDCGEILCDPKLYDNYLEGYTPFGDE